MTPERCLALMSHAPDAVADVGLVVFDECHLLSPQGGGTRSLDAMLCLLHVLKHAPNSDLLLLSAMLSNAEELAAWITEVSGRPCQAFLDPWKPSRQARGIVVYERPRLNQIRQAALAAAHVRRQGGRAPRVDRNVTPHALFGLHQNWNPGAEADIRLIKLSDLPVRFGISQSNYPTPNANDVAATLALHAVVAGLKTMVFVQQADHAPKTASKIANDLEPIAALLPAEQALWQSVIAELGGEQYSLINPRSAALPHNGDMIPAERRLAESLFRRPDGANVIVATPTLAQGMNLPAQLVILAGDKRHDAEGRAPLEAHEILNAAGRAGRAGHLANGVVLLIPDPVAAFTQAAQPEPNALAKLSSVLPPNDQCVLLEDPVTALLDKIQNGDLNDVGVRYFVSRVRPSEGTAEAAAQALQIVQRSFSGFKARRAHQEQAFNQKIEALRGILAAEREIHPEMAVIAASSGFSDGPLVAIEAKLTANINALPTSIVAWSDWLVDFLQQDQASYDALIGNNAGDALYVMRGKKSGPAPTAEEFQSLKVGLRAWLSGRPLRDVERALGAEEDDIEYCPRARDLALKLANRNLYLILAARERHLVRSVETLAECDRKRLKDCRLECDRWVSLKNNASGLCHTQ
jgi:ATP-dependent RNA helicase HelY